MRYGLILGYELEPGGKWTGQYYVADLSEFTGKDLHVDAEVGKQTNVFPLQDRYMIQNTTLKGIKRHRDIEKDWKKKVDLQDEVQEQEERVPEMLIDDIEGEDDLPPSATAGAAT